MIASSENFRVFLALLHRDLIMIRKRLKSTLLTGFIQLFTGIMIFGKLFPEMGVPKTLIAPLYLGQMCIQMFFLGNAMGFRMIYDLKYTRFIDYRLTLPLPKRWLFATNIVYFMLETMIITLPLLTLGIIILAPQFDLQHPSWLLFVITYFLILLLYALLFLSISFYYEPDWYMSNIFPRRLTILLGISPLFYLWYQAYSISSMLGLIMLLSPITYAAEGIRSTILGNEKYIAWYFCIPMILVFCGLFTLLLKVGIKKRLDPV